MIKSTFTIANELVKVRDSKCYESEFSSVIEYAEKVFGYKKSAVYEMLKTVDTYFNNGVYNIEKDSDDKELTFTQLSHLSRIKKDAYDTTNELITTNQVDSTTTIREIDEIVKSINNPEVEEVEAEEVSELEEVEAEEVSEEDKRNFAIDRIAEGFCTLVEVNNMRSAPYRELYALMAKFGIDDVTALTSLTKYFQKSNMKEVNNNENN